MDAASVKAVPTARPVILFDPIGNAAAMALVPSTGSESVRAVEMSVMRVLKAVELAVELATAAVFAGWVYVPDERGIGVTPVVRTRF
jgi:hypothetical protein